MLVLNPKAMPVTTFQEFITTVKANPGKYFFASTGSGTSSHLSGELLRIQAGLDITHVPYKGAVALNDVLAGDSVHFMFATIPSVIQFVRAGKLRALAVTSPQRSAGVPDVPTIAESGFPGFDASSWFGLVGPAGLPREITAKIAAEVARVLKQPDMREKFIQQGADPVGSTPEEFGEYMRAETAKWAKIVKASGAKVD
jgi:tripartite-type tricarboxylate transporter receptor subunit TctC